MVWSNNSSVLVWENDSEEKKQLLKLFGSPVYLGGAGLVLMHNCNQCV